MSLPSDFFKAQHLVGKRIIRRNETTDINGANVFNGRIFVLRNEAWEPHLSHAASIADKATKPAIAFVLTIDSPVASLLAT